MSAMLPHAKAFRALAKAIADGIDDVPDVTAKITLTGLGLALYVAANAIMNYELALLTGKEPDDEKRSDGADGETDKGCD